MAAEQEADKKSDENPDKPEKPEAGEEKPEAEDVDGEGAKKDEDTGDGKDEGDDKDGKEDEKKGDGDKEKEEEKKEEKEGEEKKEEEKADEEKSESKPEADASEKPARPLSGLAAQRARLRQMSPEERAEFEKQRKKRAFTVSAILLTISLGFIAATVWLAWRHFGPREASSIFPLKPPPRGVPGSRTMEEIDRTLYEVRDQFLAGKWCPAYLYLKRYRALLEKFEKAMNTKAQEDGLDITEHQEWLKDRRWCVDALQKKLDPHFAEPGDIDKCEAKEPYMPLLEMIREAKLLAKKEPARTRGILEEAKRKIDGEYAKAEKREDDMGEVIANHLSMLKQDVFKVEKQIDRIEEEAKAKKRPAKTGMID